VFGGQSEHNLNPLNDLWRWDGTNWTWMSGSQMATAPPVLGPLGTLGPTYIPGARSGGAAFVDSSSNLWLFGGVGIDSTGSSGDMADLWMYQP
jgi:hypothetical protein